VPQPLYRTPRVKWAAAGPTKGERAIAEETPVAVTYNRGTYTIMMATPSDREDYALGFSLTESVINSGRDIESLEVLDTGVGIELSMWLCERGRRWCASVGATLSGRPDAACAALSRSAKPCDRPPLSGLAGH
jgi:formate dehydrogenase assembly factor FdhD